MIHKTEVNDFGSFSKAVLGQRFNICCHKWREVRDASVVGKLFGH